MASLVQNQIPRLALGGHCAKRRRTAANARGGKSCGSRSFKTRSTAPRKPGASSSRAWRLCSILSASIAFIPWHLGRKQALAWHEPGSRRLLPPSSLCRGSVQSREVPGSQSSGVQKRPLLAGEARRRHREVSSPFLAQLPSPRLPGSSCRPAKPRPRKHVDAAGGVWPTRPAWRAAAKVLASGER